jgi:small-conductance mechanosensitive channel
MAQDALQGNSLLLAGWNLAIPIAAVIAAKIIQIILVKFFRSKRLFRGDLTHRIIDRVQRPLLWLLIFLSISIALPLTHLPETWLSRIFLILKPTSVATLGWLVIGIAHGTGAWLETHYSGKKSRDALGARRFTTQIHILMRVVISVIIVLTVVGMAIVVPALRQLGMSLFASAGVAGIVLGIAAKESFSNLIAGAQLALTQQILLGDEVVIKDQFGTIEEITSSYVVIRTWDLRRLVIPLRYFMENSFENWTYHEPDLLAPVYLYTDYTIDIGKLRTEAQRIVKQSSLWDGKYFDLLVTDSKENTLQVRVSASAKNSSDAWILQCETREKLIAYLQAAQLEALPKTRVELKQTEVSSI